MYWVAALYVLIELAFAGRYGYHRDELYFLAAGRHLDWGYADQPPLVPVIARAMAAIDPNSLVLLRFPAILAVAGVIVCTGWMAREFGGGRGARALAAGVMGTSMILVGAGHLMGTTAFDLLATAGIVVALLRVLRVDGDPRWWLVVGALVGVGLMNKALLVFPVVGLAAAFVVCGPQKMFATKYFALAVGIGLVLWAPYLWWQARHGWPQWALSRAIAGGSSGTSNSPLEFVLVQLVLAGLFAVPVWGYGWWRLWREPRYRGFAVAYVLLFVVFLVTGGKGYYLAGMYPVLVAAGAVPFAAWLGAHRRAWVAVVPAGLVNAAMAVVLFLPVFPVAALAHSPIVAVNYDMGETVGWPDLVAQVAAARARYAPSAGLLTANYGEAGAIERFGGAYGLPTPHSGHNSYWWWGPPPGAEPVLTVGIPAERLTALCADLRPAGRLDNGLDLDNDEQHAPLSVCTPRVPWATAWPRMKGLG